MTEQKDLTGPVIAEYPAIGYSVAVIDLTPAERPAYLDGDGHLWGVYRVAVERDGTVVASFLSNVDDNAFDLAERLAAGTYVVAPGGSAVSNRWAVENLEV